MYLAGLKFSLHTKQTINLAWPLVLTQVGHVLTGIVDNIFLGQLGTTEQAAGILSNNLFSLLLVFTIGVSYASTPLVTKATEEGDGQRSASLFKNALLLNLLVALGCVSLLYAFSGQLDRLGQPAEVTQLAIPFFELTLFSMLPMAFFFTGKQYCEGKSNTKLALAISIGGNLINVMLNYALIYGKLGLPVLGYMGSAWASFIARTLMGVFFLFYIFRSVSGDDLRNWFFRVRINLRDLRDLSRIGFNAGLQFTFEVAAFSIAGLMAGRFGKENIDAHGIALSIATFTYMFASGISGAATIRVGTFASQRNPKELQGAVRAAIHLVLLVMGLFAIVFLMASSLLPLAFTNNHDITRLTSQLLIIAAMFQLFDGIQVTVLGMLRGLEDVRVPTWITLVAYWLLAVPLAYLLAFEFEWQTLGIWVALLAALVLIAGALSLRLRHLLRKKFVQP